jgi:aryl-alcohol dehydrogenase-like predicted oxidoreductase
VASAKKPSANGSRAATCATKYKGAHTPQCDPVNLTKQLKESLDRLQMDHMDIYMMHRDNLDIPVGEFVDVLNEHKAAGRIKIFGGSNWTAERIDALNDYARKNGKTGFVAISNNLSLARMVDAPWPGCISVSDPKLMAWHRTTKMPLIPWSSQARGFFTLGDPNYTADKELVRCWYSEDNFKRQARARELAAKKGVTPIQIALAYVLNQEFPTFALIGPRSIEETRTSFDALKIQLTPQEVRWLNLEA